MLKRCNLTIICAHICAIPEHIQNLKFPIQTGLQRLFECFEIIYEYHFAMSKILLTLIWFHRRALWWKVQRVQPRGCLKWRGRNMRSIRVALSKLEGLCMMAVALDRMVVQTGKEKSRRLITEKTTDAVWLLLIKSLTPCKNIKIKTDLIKWASSPWNMINVWMSTTLRCTLYGGGGLAFLEQYTGGSP